MAVATYPSNVPHVPLRDPYDVSKRHAPLTVTEMEDGPKRQRASSTAVWSQHAYQIVMTLAEFAVFDTFVIQTLVKGAARFMMPVGRIQAPLPWPLKLVYLEEGEFTVRPIGDGTVVVSFTLNVLDW